jgi:7tm Chemosensory receptor
MLRLVGVIYRSLGILPISYSRPSQRFYPAKPFYFLYSIFTIAVYLYCSYVHITSSLTDYDSTNLHGNRAIADIYNTFYYFIYVSILLAGYCPVFLNRKEFATCLNQLIKAKDCLSTIMAANNVGRERRRLKLLVIISTFVIMQLLAVGGSTVLGTGLMVAEAGVFPSIETIITWNTCPFLSNMFVLLFILFVLEVKKMMDEISEILKRMRQNQC